MHYISVLLILTEREELQPLVPEDKDEEHEQHAEGGNVVHCLHEDHQLATQGGHEAHQLQHPEQPESSEHGKTAVRLPDDLPDTAGSQEQLSTAVLYTESPKQAGFLQGFTPFKS